MRTVALLLISAFLMLVCMTIVIVIIRKERVGEEAAAAVLEHERRGLDDEVLGLQRRGLDHRAAEVALHQPHPAVGRERRQVDLFGEGQGKEQLSRCWIPQTQGVVVACAD